MKNIVSLSIIVFIWLSNFNFVLSAHFSQGSTVTPFKYLAKFASDQPTLQHRVVKRQTSAPTPEDKAICDAQKLMMSCAQLEYSKVLLSWAWVVMVHIAVSKKPKVMQNFVRKMKVDSSVDHFGSVTESGQTT